MSGHFETKRSEVRNHMKSLTVRDCLSEISPSVEMTLILLWYMSGHFKTKQSEVRNYIKKLNCV